MAGQLEMQIDVRAVLSRFVLAVVAGGLMLVLAFHLLFQIDGESVFSVVMGMLLYLAAATLAGYHLKRDYPHTALGLCNLVTLLRLVIVSLFFIVAIEKITPVWATFAIAVFALCLDGVDGWFARTQGLSSDFGARFDVEVDAAFALILSICAAINGASGFFVVLLGLPYYLFRVAKALLPWLRRDLPEHYSRKVVCVFQIAVLAALQLPVLSGGQLDTLVVLVAAALTWSFTRDIVWLWQVR
jgi:phosphatidylglycerophosphate synthase